MMVLAGLPVINARALVRCAVCCPCDGALIRIRALPTQMRHSASAPKDAGAVAEDIDMNPVVAPR